MKSALTTILKNTQAQTSHMRDSWQKAIDVSPAVGGMTSFSESAKQRQQYNSYQGHLYAAINAIAMAGAKQPVNLGRLAGSNGSRTRRSLSRVKAADLSKSLQDVARKSPEMAMELILDHPLLDALNQPNDWQTRWSFTYSFIANVALTGRAYVVADYESEETIRFYQIPSSWVQPNASHTEFKIVNPRNRSSNDDMILTRENIAFASMPNPADPSSSYAPASSQMRAISIDQNIQASQEMFFHNGIFPSVVVTVGADPHPAAGGPSFRPRLTGAQRRSVSAAIKKVMSGVANYGNPAIIDGMIDGIERLSATSNEMGWEKSENRVRARILSAYRVHPFILGEAVNVGGYAQAAVIKSEFCDTVNTYLDMQGCVMSSFTKGRDELGEDLHVWYEPCKSEDPQIESQEWREARKNGDVTENEVRQRLGLAPSENGDRSAMLRPENLVHLTQVLRDVRSGALTSDQGRAILQIVMDATTSELNKLIPDDAELIDDESLSSIELKESIAAVRESAQLLKADPLRIAQQIVDDVS